ncbi:unnamed protein product [Meloidogyne enterolobii]|uniref:Uncharacterized protein n=1 Tax=Meloidogyne enterolobii TaxID=390850 RepID=A0ACB0XX39_MELEN
MMLFFRVSKNFVRKNCPQIFCGQFFFSFKSVTKIEIKKIYISLLSYFLILYSFY